MCSSSRLPAFWNGSYIQCTPQLVQYPRGRCCVLFPSLPRRVAPPQGLTFYFVMPVMLGFIVQSYMAAKLPGTEANSQPLAPRATSSKPPTPRRSNSNRDVDGIGSSASGGSISSLATVGGGLNGLNLQREDSSRLVNFELDIRKTIPMQRSFSMVLLGFAEQGGGRMYNGHNIA